MGHCHCLRAGHMLGFGGVTTMLGIVSDMIMYGLDFPPSRLKKMGCVVIFCYLLFV